MKGGARKRHSAKQPQSASHDSSHKDTESTTDAKQKLDTSGLYDTQQVKRLLDDEIIAFMEDQGYAEATLVSNIKIIAGSLAVIAAIYSHFGPGEFPANKPIVFACVAFYLFCMGLINLSCFIFEASAVFVGCLTTNAQETSNGSLVSKIWILTSFEHKGSSLFRIEMRIAPRRKHDAIEASHPYERYITDEGRFLAEVFRKDLKTLLLACKGNSKKSN